MQILLNKQCKLYIFINLLTGIRTPGQWFAMNYSFDHVKTNILTFTDKADKLAEIEKTERQVQQQQEREDEMREMALRLRRRYEKSLKLK